MPTFRIIHPVQIVVRYEAATPEEARAKAAQYEREHTVYDLLDKARDLYITEPLLDGDDGADV
jgi:hypothetical protein